MSVVPQSPNRLLASLTAADYRVLLARLHTMHLESGDQLTQCAQTRVYFPGSGMCSVRNVMRDGRTIEVAAIGNEGVVGLATLSNSSASPGNLYVQVGQGSAQFILIEDLRSAVSRSDALRRCLDSYAQAFLQDIMQSAACNRSHTLEERCARWILVAHDKLHENRFEISRKSMAGALGVNHRKLSVVMKRLSFLGAIECDVEHLAVVDVPKLESLVCYCYGRMKRAIEADDAPHRPPSTGGNLVRLLPEAVCERCELVDRLPHATEHDCIAALDRELIGINRRQVELGRKRHFILALRLKVINEFLKRARESAGLTPQGVRKRQ